MKTFTVRQLVNQTLGYLKRESAVVVDRDYTPIACARLTLAIQEADYISTFPFDGPIITGIHIDGDTFGNDTELIDHYAQGDDCLVYEGRDIGVMVMTIPDPTADWGM